MAATPYSFARGVHNTRVTVSEEDTTLAELRSRFKKPVALEMRSIEYHNAPKAARGNVKKALPYFVGGVIEGKRHDSNVAERTLLTLDIEAPSVRANETEAQRRKRESAGQPPDPHDVFDTLETLGMEGWVYTSLSHTPAAPRYRVVLPLRSPIQGRQLTEEVMRASTRAAATMLGIDAWCTPESWVLSQPMYLPAKLRDGVFWEAYTAGQQWRIVGKPEPADIPDGPADIPDGHVDPVLHALQRAGLYLHEDEGHKGKHFITCPFVDQHGSENETQTVYYEAHHDGNPRPAVKCFDTDPDEDGVPHLTYKTLVNFLRDGGWLKGENADTSTVLEDYDAFRVKAGVGQFLKSVPEERNFAWERFAPVGKVTVLAGPGGVSKSMLMLHLLVHGALGQSWGGFDVRGPVKGLYASYEDDSLELHKRVHRLAQALREADDGLGDMLHDIDGALQKNLLLYAADDDAIKWLLMVKPDQRGAPERTARVEWLVGLVRHLGLKVLVLDPVVYTHNLEESSPGDMALYMQTLTYIAKTGNCAVVVLHHMHKTAQWATLEDINQGSLRGASSFADNSRSVGVLVSVPPKDAPRFGLPAEGGAQYAYFKHVKHNYSAPMEPTIFERRGPLLIPTAIRQLSPDAVREAQEEAKQRSRVATLEHKAFTLVGWLADSEGATTNMIREGTGIRFTLLKELLTYAVGCDWVTEENSVNRSKLYSVTKEGHVWFKQQQTARLAEQKNAKKDR